MHSAPSLRSTSAPPPLSLVPRAGLTLTGSVPRGAPWPSGGRAAKAHLNSTDAPWVLFLKMAVTRLGVGLQLKMPLLGISRRNPMVPALKKNPYERTLHALGRGKEGAVAGEALQALGWLLNFGVLGVMGFRVGWDYSRAG